MRSPDLKHLVLLIYPITLAAALICSVLPFSGCGPALGVILTPGPFEKKTVPDYNLKEQQDRKVLVWIECPRSSGADYDVQEKLASAFELTLTQKGGFDRENIILNPITDSQKFLLDPVQIARSKGAGYVLLIQVDAYSADYLRVRNYYSGEIITRAVLQDVNLGRSIWPKQPEGKMVHISVEMETEGHDALISRMTAAVAHCTLRNLYPCDKLTFKHIDERISMQEAFELETY